MASPLAHLVSVFTQLHKQGPPSLPSLCSVLAEEVINSFTRGLSSEPSPTQRSPTGGPWTASSPQMCFVWLFLCVFLIVGLAANTLKIMKFLTQMQISTFEKNHKGHITAYEQLASGAEAAPGFQFSGGSLRRGTLAVPLGWASPHRYLATPPQGHPGASHCPQAIEVSAVLASLELTR